MKKKSYPIIPRKAFLPPPPELQIFLSPANPGNDPEKKNWTLIPHVHDFMELVLVLSGTASQWINGHTYPVFRGDIFLLRGDVAHCFVDHRNLQLMNVLFVPEELPLPYELLKKVPGYQMFFLTEPSLRANKSESYGLHLTEEAIEVMEGLLSKLELILKEHDVGYEVKALTLFQQIILTISENYGSVLQASSGRIPRIVDVISRMEHDFAHPWTLNELADLACTSPRNFLRLFSSVTGSSPVDYLQRLRLNHAAEMLRHGVGIAEVSESCGFANANYFNKRFRKFHGVSPRAFCQPGKIKK